MLAPPTESKPTTPRTPPRIRGAIVRLIGDRGFAFVQPDQEQRTIFVHASQVRGSAFDALTVGMRVSLVECPDSKGRGTRGADVRAIADDADDADDTDEPTTREPINIAPLPGPRMHGTVSKVFTDHGYGFLKPADSCRAVFFHASALRNIVFMSLAPGDCVHWLDATDDQGRPRALDVHPDDTPTLTPADTPIPTQEATP